MNKLNYDILTGKRGRGGGTREGLDGTTKLESLETRSVARTTRPSLRHDGASSDGLSPPRDPDETSSRSTTTGFAPAVARGRRANRERDPRANDPRENAARTRRTPSGAPNIRDTRIARDGGGESAGLFRPLLPRARRLRASVCEILRAAALAEKNRRTRFATAFPSLAIKRALRGRVVGYNHICIVS